MPISVQVINSVPCVVRTAWHNHERDRAFPSLPALWRSCMLLVVVLSIEEELRWVPGLVGASAESYCARVTVGVRFVSPRLLSEHVGSAEDAVPSSRIAWGFGIVPLLASSTVCQVWRISKIPMTLGQKAAIAGPRKVNETTSSKRENQTTIWNRFFCSRPSRPPQPKKAVSPKAEHPARTTSHPDPRTPSSLGGVEGGSSNAP